MWNPLQKLLSFKVTVSPSFLETAVPNEYVQLSNAVGLFLGFLNMVMHSRLLSLLLLLCQCVQFDCRCILQAFLSYLVSR